MRILFVSPHYPPDMGALAARVRDLTREWARAGHEVHVLAGLPNHPTGVIPPEYRGKTYVRDEYDGVVVHRTWLYAARNKGKVRRSLSFASYAGSAVLLGQHRVPRPDVVIGTSPQFLAAVAGAVIARWKRAPLVVEIRDLWPDELWEMGVMPREHPVIRLLERLELWLYAEAAEVVTVTNGFVDHLVGKAPRLAGRVSVVTNGVVLERFDPATDPSALRAELGLPDGPIALYAGTHGISQGLEVVVDAARRAPRVQFVLIGEGARKEAIVAAARDVPNVHCHPGVPAQRMPEVYALADVFLVPLRDLPSFATTIPSKIFEVLAMERPLVVGVRGEAARVVEASGGGVAVPPDDPVALATAVQALVDDPVRRAEMGRRGRAHVAAHYTRAVLAQRYLGVLERAASQRAARGWRWLRHRTA